MLESGEFTTIAELAERERIAQSYMTPVLRLTLLTPEVIEKNSDGRQPEGMTLPRLMEPFPSEWEIQKNQWLIRYDGAGQSYRYHLSIAAPRHTSGCGVAF